MKLLAWSGLTLVALLGSGNVSRADDRPLRSVIDTAIEAAWQKEQLNPSRLSSDAGFLRRVALDLIGTVPAYDETVAFLADTAADKRAQLIDRLLSDPRYAQHQADVWDGIFFGRDPPGYDTDRREGFQAWLRTQFQENRPWNELARTILRAEGNSVEQGAPQVTVVVGAGARWSGVGHRPTVASLSIDKIASP